MEHALIACENLVKIYKVADLEEAIEKARKSVQSTPDGNPDRVGFLGNLGNELERRYKHTGKVTDLEEAIVVIRQAVELTPHTHPDRAAWLSNLGNTLERLSAWFLIRR